MSRVLPKDIKYNILNYLPIPQTEIWVIDPYFWIQRIAFELSLDLAAIHKMLLLSKTDLSDIIRTAACFNIVLPSAECYMSSLQCYLTLLL